MTLTMSQLDFVNFGEEGSVKEQPTDPGKRDNSFVRRIAYFRLHNSTSR